MDLLEEAAKTFSAYPTVSYFRRIPLATSMIEIKVERSPSGSYDLDGTGKIKITIILMKQFVMNNITPKPIPGGINPGFG